MNGVLPIVSSAAAGAAVGVATGSPEMGTACFVAGWAIDLDHALDFGLKWGLRGALARMARLGIGPINLPNTAILFLHAYEVSGLLFALALAFPASPWIMGVALGHLFHLLLDQATNVRRWNPTYFLTYRALCRFDHELCFPGGIREDRATPEETLRREPIPQTVTADIPSETRPPSSPSGS